MLHHTLGIILRNNSAELIDDDTPGKTQYSLMGLYAAMAEGEKLMRENPDIIKINVYEVHDGKRSISATGKYQLVHCLLREGAQ